MGAPHTKKPLGALGARRKPYSTGCYKTVGLTRPRSRQLALLLPRQLRWVLKQSFFTTSRAELTISLLILQKNPILIASNLSQKMVRSAKWVKLTHDTYLICGSVVNFNFYYHLSAEGS